MQTLQNNTNEQFDISYFGENHDFGNYFAYVTQENTIPYEVSKQHRSLDQNIYVSNNVITYHLCTRLSHLYVSIITVIFLIHFFGITDEKQELLFIYPRSKRYEALLNFLLDMQLLQCIFPNSKKIYVNLFQCFFSMCSSYCSNKEISFIQVARTAKRKQDVS